MLVERKRSFAGALASKPAKCEESSRDDYKHNLSAELGGKFSQPAQVC